MNKRTTLADIALKTGYGTNTVSLALRGSTRISQVARERIQEVARELDYIPNNIAKSLVMKRSNSVGLILHDIGNPALTNIAKLIQSALDRQGYSMLFATSNGSLKDEITAIRAFRSQLIDGLLVYPATPLKVDHLVKLRERGVPVVIMGDTPHARIDTVGVDAFNGAFRAVSHLLDHGHRNIGIIAADFGTSARKRDGYAAALGAAGVKTRDDLVGQAPTHSIAGGLAAMDVLMRSENPPTAIFACSDLYALGALRWAKINGKAVPDDLAIVGFDDTEAGRLAVTPISSIHNDTEALAQLAVDRIIALIDPKGAPPPPAAQLVESELIIRESSHDSRAKARASLAS